jgi:glucose/arabinose dehydrogenase
MGPKGGDELNLIAKGENYGWPLATYGREYYGLSIGSKAVAGTTQPVAHWVPSISPSGSMIYQGSAFKGWVDNIFIGCLSGLHIRRLVLKDKKVIKEENLLEGENLRIRNIRSGPDGLIYFSTDSGMIARFKPAQQ